jgi:hypothetical protein
VGLSVQAESPYDIMSDHCHGWSSHDKWVEQSRSKKLGVNFRFLA